MQVDDPKPQPLPVHSEPPPAKRETKNMLEPSVHETKALLEPGESDAGVKATVATEANSGDVLPIRPHGGGAFAGFFNFVKGLFGAGGFCAIRCA